MTIRTFMPFRVYWGVSSTAKYSLCCGSRTRTCDLWIMRPASYQLLHSAILKTCLSSQIYRLKRLMFNLKLLSYKLQS